MASPAEASATPSPSDLQAAHSLIQALLEGRDGAASRAPQLVDEHLLRAVATLAAESRKHDLSGLWDGAADAAFYDEVFDEHGQHRPAYAQAMLIMDKLARAEKQKHRIDEFPQESVKGFFGDNRLYHLPRMLSQSDHQTLLTGIAQRAQALRHLVLDLNKQRGKWQVSNLDCVRGRAMPEFVLRRTAARAAVQWNHNLVDKKIAADALYWSMWYGPDIVRGPDGDWYVLEDNLGYVGGFGDLSLARRVLLGQTKRANGFPELEPVLGKNRTEEFYNELAKHYHRHCKEDETPVILYYNRGIRDDNEDRRVLEIFKRRGVQPVELPGDDGPKPYQPRLEVRNDRVYLITQGKPKASRDKENKDTAAANAMSPPPKPSPAKDTGVAVGKACPQDFAAFKGGKRPPQSPAKDAGAAADQTPAGRKRQKRDPAASPGDDIPTPPESPAPSSPRTDDVLATTTVRGREWKDTLRVQGQVLRAWYGAPGHEWTNVNGRDVTAKVKQLLGKADTIEVSTRNLGISDPAHGTNKVLLVESESRRTIRAHEWQEPLRVQGAVLRAWYGAPGHEWTAENGKDVTAKVKELVANAGTAEVAASAKVFGDPAHGTNKVLVVEEEVTPCKIEPVGMIVLLSESCDIEPGHESAALRSAIAEARNRISEYEAQAEKEFLKASRAEKTVVSVPNTVVFKDTGGEMNTLKMEEGELFWCIGDEEKVPGPLSWNRHNGKITGGEWYCKPDAKGRKELEGCWELCEVPLMAYQLQQEAKKLKEAVEPVGQLVGKRVNSRGRQELFRLLRSMDREAWNRLMKGKRGVPGLLEAYYAGKVKIANGPGFELIEDKELCQYVEHLIRFYLKEEPILKTVPTKSFALATGGGDLDLLRRVFDDPSSQRNCVVKRVDGRGGDGVWVGAKIPREKFLAARPLVAAEPEAFIVQKYTCLSQVHGHLVDIRGPAFICSSDVEGLSGGEGVACSPVLWGRGVPSQGSTGKVNISEAGFEFAIGVAQE